MFLHYTSTPFILLKLYFVFSCALIAGALYNAIHSFTGCLKKIDIVFAIDGSSSVGRRNFQRVKTFLRRIAKSFHISRTASRVAVIVYSSRVKVAFNFKRYTNGRTLDAALRRLRYPRGGTRTGLAMNRAVQLFKRNKRRRKTLVIITDGLPGDDVTRPNQLLKRAKVEIFAVGIGRRINEKHLRKIATDGRHVYMVTFANLYKFVKSLKTKVCTGNALVLNFAFFTFV